MSNDDDERVVSGRASFAQPLFNVALDVSRRTHLWDGDFRPSAKSLGPLFIAAFIKYSPSWTDYNDALTFRMGFLSQHISSKMPHSGQLCEHIQKVDGLFILDVDHGALLRCNWNAVEKLNRIITDACEIISQLKKKAFFIQSKHEWQILGLSILCETETLIISLKSTDCLK